MTRRKEQKIQRGGADCIKLNNISYGNTLQDDCARSTDNKKKGSCYRKENGDCIFIEYKNANSAYTTNAAIAKAAENAKAANENAGNGMSLLHSYKIALEAISKAQQKQKQSKRNNFIDRQPPLTSLSQGGARTSTAHKK